MHQLGPSIGIKTLASISFSHFVWKIEIRQILPSCKAGGSLACLPGTLVAWCGRHHLHTHAAFLRRLSRYKQKRAMRKAVLTHAGLDNGRNKKIHAAEPLSGRNPCQQIKPG
jgi:hypothetical protein